MTFRRVLEILGLSEYVDGLLEGMEARSLLDRLTAGAQEASRFFSRHGIEDRERAACAGFLRCMGEPFDIGEIRIHRPDPPDVLFRDARFEVTTAMAPGHEPHGKFKQEADNLRIASSVDELFGPLHLREPRHFDDVLRAVEQAGAQKIPRPNYESAVRAEIDLLVYVNYPDHFLDRSTVKGSAARLGRIAAQGWRSVSFVTDCEAFVCSATASAPPWLVSRVRQLCVASDQDLFHAGRGGLFRLS